MPTDDLPVSASESDLEYIPNTGKRQRDDEEDEEGLGDVVIDENGLEIVDSNDNNNLAVMSDPYMLLVDVFTERDMDRIKRQPRSKS